MWFVFILGCIFQLPLGSATRSFFYIVNFYGVYGSNGLSAVIAARICTSPVDYVMDEVAWAEIQNIRKNIDIVEADIRKRNAYR